MNRSENIQDRNICLYLEEACIFWMNQGSNSQSMSNYILIYSNQIFINFLTLTFNLSWHNCNEMLLDLLNWKIVVSILIFWQFSNAFDLDILMASLLGNTILAGTRKQGTCCRYPARARNQHYFNHFVSTFTVFEYTFEARVYFFQILLARHQHTRSYSLLDMMNLLHIFLYSLSHIDSHSFR